MKKEFRKNVINNRKQQSDIFIYNNSIKIAETLISMDFIKNAKNIMLYLDFKNEVQTNELIKKLISLGKIVSCPITLKNDKKLLPYKICDLEKSIKIGAYGIREPREDICPPINIMDIDVVIVPAVAYDVNCYRLGYGGGFYDRFIENLRHDAITVGLAFDLQIFESIPIESHDAQLDYVITESKILTCKI